MPTRIAQATATITTVPPTKVPTSSSTTTSGIGSTKISADGATMFYVPAGKFWMGTDRGRGHGSGDDEPEHEVDLDAFWIDKFEVTNALYKKCVDAGKCDAPKSSGFSGRSSYYGNSQSDNFPVVNVTFDNASQYCAFAKKQLPTEAQWVKAARGTDKRIYPWGDTFDVSKLNSPEGTTSGTTAVGSYPSGASPYGALDMAGNVMEWVADWSGTWRITHGGSCGMGGDRVRVAARDFEPSDYWSEEVGFRCVE